MPAWLPIIMGGSAALSALTGNRQQQGANRLQRQALQSAQRNYDERAPFRMFARSELERANNAPDFSAIFADPGNPYSPQARAQAPAAPSSMPPGGMGGGGGMEDGGDPLQRFFMARQRRAMR
jgi:hypothetical protein